MTNYREILRLKKLGLNNSQIAQSLGCSRMTVIQVLNAAKEKGISYPLPEDLSDRKLSELLFPSDRSKPEYKMPDYVRLPELLTELAIARGNGTYRKVIQQYKKPALLILDEWLLYPLKETEARDLLELAEARYKKASTIFCSQFDVPGWREKIGDPILADAICDRIVHDSYSIVIDCKESMRKRKGVKENEA